MIRANLHIWMTLMLRDIRTRRGQARLNYLLALIEPFGQLTIVYLVFVALRRRPDFGDSMFLFLLTGVLPYFLFTHIVARIMGAGRVAQSLLALRVVNVVDVAIAQLVLETLTLSLAGALIFLGCWALEVPNARPADIVQLLLSVLMIALTAFGVGLCNGCLVTFFAAYRMIWTLIARSLLFFSSILYVIEVLPPAIRNVLWWNPLLHGVIWFRAGVFATYPTETLSYGYMTAFCIGSILLGLAMERIVRRRA
jgi:capsular polysaccharide transport system permease protein